MRVHELLYPAISQYQQLLTEIENTDISVSEERIFQVLLARDAVQDALHKGETPPCSLWITLAILDKRLQKQQAKLKQSNCWKKHKLFIS